MVLIVLTFLNISLKDFARRLTNAALRARVRQGGAGVALLDTMKERSFRFTITNVVDSC